MLNSEEISGFEGSLRKMHLKIKNIEGSVAMREQFPICSDAYNFDVVDNADVDWGRVTCINGMLSMYLMKGTYMKYKVVYQKTVEMSFENLMTLATAIFDVSYSLEP